MSGSFLRQLGMVCIFGTMLPQVAAASIAVHALHEHGHEDGHSAPAPAIMPVLHGHVHSADTPEHDHSLTAPASGPVASRARGPLQQLALPADGGSGQAAHALAGVSAARHRPADERPPQTTPTVLRI